MKKGQVVKLTKIEHSEEADYTLESTKFEEEGTRYCGVPTGHTVTGILLKDVNVGESFEMHRRSRNGVEVAGIFITSPLTDITEDVIKTGNSVYKYEIL